jgi:hypothetical protein
MVQYPEIGGMVLILECIFVLNFIRCLVLRVKEGEGAGLREQRLKMEESLLDADEQEDEDDPQLAL